MKLQVEKKGGMAASSNARISWDTLHYCCISTQTQFRRSSTPKKTKVHPIFPKVSASPAQAKS